MLCLLFSLLLISQISATYCFPGEILNLTDDPSYICTFIVRESSGCGYFGTCGGLKELSMNCDGLNTYGLLTRDDGSSVSDATFRLTTYLLKNYSITPVQIPSNGIDYKTSLCCSKNQVAYYNQITLTFPKPNFTIEEIPCSGSTLLNSLMLIVIIVWFCVV